MEQRNITDDEINNQSIYSSDSWFVLLPKRPISPYHFLIIPKRDDVKHFTALRDDELADMRRVIGFVVEAIERRETPLNGYNLFSNNGTYEIGQHLSRFHQHIFIRIENESESPYVTMSSGRRWSEIDSSEWAERLSELRLLFSS